VTGVRGAGASLARTLRGSQVDDPDLREKARRAIREGRLPGCRPDQTWGGPGSAAECPICGTLVGQDELELEIAFARNGDAVELDAYHLHLSCWAAWDSERQPGEIHGTVADRAPTGDAVIGGTPGSPPAPPPRACPR